MAESEILRRRLERLFVDALNIEPPLPDADLIEGGVLDSLTLVELLLAIEEEFGIRIPPDLEIEQLRTIERLCRLVETCGALEAPAGT